MGWTCTGQDGWKASPTQTHGHEFEQTPGDSEGQGSLVCCSPWSHRVEHNLATEQQQTSISCNMSVKEYQLNL